MNDHAGRRDAAYEATLAAIDDATERRCSQCHEPLPADSASEWWCGPACQQAWGQQHTDNPREVLERQDAAAVYEGRDAVRVPLNDRPRHPADEWLRRTYGHLEIWDETHAFRAAPNGFHYGGPVRRAYVDREELARRFAAALERDPELLERAFAPMRQAIGLYVEAVRTAFRGVGAAIAQMERAGRLRTPPLEDPRERALEARRNRNTGPRQRSRAPQRIDPRRSR